jgi:hypothetical protein
MYKYLALSGLLLFAACGLAKKSTGSGNFRYGQTHEQVLKSFEGRTELMIAEFNRPRGHLVAYQYSKIGRSASQEGQFYMYFMNDTLIRKSAPEDVQAGAEIAEREYYKKKREQEQRMQEREEARLAQEQKKQQQAALREEKQRKKAEEKTEVKERSSKKKKRSSKD